MLTRQLLFSLVIAFGVINAPSVFSMELNKLQLKSLLPNNDGVVNSNENVSTIAMIYQPGCKWCKKQGKLLAKIQRACASHANVAIIGAYGSTQKLKRELRHFDKNLPAFEANKKFLIIIKGVEAFPTTIVFDKEGELIAKKRGYIKPKHLAQVMAAITEQHCDIEI